MEKLCVYCGSSDNIDKIYLDAAYAMGELLADRKITLIYGAGSTGLMGALADGVLEHGGDVIGVLPRMFHTPQLAHAGLTRLELVDSMHTRKARMAELADGFVALPGGFGTLEEVMEILTWSQIGLHKNPVGFLNTAGYYDPLIQLMNSAREKGFIYNEHKELYAVASTPDALLDAMMNHNRPAGLERWVTRES